MAVAAAVFLLVTGSAILSFVVAWQVKTVSPEIEAVIRYNLMMLPLFFLANTALGAGFIRMHETVKNLPLIVAAQSFMYYAFLLAFSVLLVNDKVLVNRAVAGFMLIATGIAMLK